MHSRIIQKPYGYVLFPKTKLVFALYGFSIKSHIKSVKTISFVPNGKNVENSAMQNNTLNNEEAFQT